MTPVRSEDYARIGVQRIPRSSALASTELEVATFAGFSPLIAGGPPMTAPLDIAVLGRKSNPRVVLDQAGTPRTLSPSSYTVVKRLLRRLPGTPPQAATALAAYTLLREGHMKLCCVVFELRFLRRIAPMVLEVHLNGTASSVAIGQLYLSESVAR